MISAKEAYKLAAPNLDKYREFIDKRIRKAANDGKTEIMIYDDPYNMWLYNEQDLPAKDPDGARVVKELRDLGYRVSQYYSDGQQFADVALVIKWDKQ